MLEQNFTHRQLYDGTFQSVCNFCFFLVAVAKREEELALAERRHFCPERHSTTASGNPVR
jgi:hypothetical protein